MIDVWSVVPYEAPARGWVKIKGYTSDQMRVIRSWAEDFRDAEHLKGFPTLRGFHMFMRARDWDYYNVIKEFYGE